MEFIATGKNFKTLARMGYGARGVVYLMIGGLALLTAFGEGGKTTDSKGAITEIMQQPFGYVLLTVLIIGLFGYVVWRFTQAVKDTDGHGNDPQRPRSAQRIIYQCDFAFIFSLLGDDIIIWRTKS